MSGGRGFIGKFFDNSGTIKIPAGITKVFLIGCGGGSGGNDGASLTGYISPGGNGAVPLLKVIDVVPNTTYTISIGAGGAGFGRPGPSVNGGDTTFGSLATFNGAQSWFDLASPAGMSIAAGVNNSGVVSANLSRGWRANAGARGSDSGSYRGGTGGACGYTGVGAAGGNASNSGKGANASNASATNYGAGGGGGGCGPSGGGTGGDGAPGFLWVIWIEGQCKITQKTFTSSDTLTIPAGVTSLIAFGQGGGGGGSLGDQVATKTGGSGGKSTYLVPFFTQVTPNTSYSVTIGFGGTGGTLNTGFSGGDTSLGALMTWVGALPGTNGAGYSTAQISNISGPAIDFPISVFGATNGADTSKPLGNSAVYGSYAARGTNGGPTSSSGGGGGGGNSSDAGIGGVGGDGAPSGVGAATSGGNAPSTSYGAGGGGGGGTNGSGSPGAGGNGAGGRLIVIWAE